MKLQKLLNPLLIILLAIFFTIIFTWPFATKIQSFFYDRGDYQLTVATLSFNEYALRTGKIFNPDYYFHGYQFYPQPYALVYSDLRLFPTLIYAPIFWITQNIVLSVNLTTLLTFIFSFISSFYVIFYFTKHKLASLIGALIYTFNPLTFARLPEHFELLNKYLLPLVFLFAYRFFTTPNLKNSLLFFTSFTLNAFTATYFQIMSILLLPLFIAPITISYIQQRNTRAIKKIIKFSLIFIIFLPIIFYFDKAYLDFSGHEGSRRSLEENSFYSARLIDYFSSTPVNWFYGEFVSSIEKDRAPRVEGSAYGAFNYQEHTLFLNVIPFFLFLVSLYFFIKLYKQKNIPKEFKLLLISLILLLLTSFFFTFGPYFQGWNNTGSTLKLPFYYLYQVIPLFQGIRAPTRFAFIFYIPFSLFAAFGARYIFQKIQNKFILFLTFGLVIGLLWVENYTPQTIDHSYDETSAFLIESENSILEGNLSFLTDQEILHLPIYSPFNDFESIYLLWSLLTHEKNSNGNRGSFIPVDQAVFLDNLNKKLDGDSLKDLFVLNFDYLIFHKDMFINGLGQYNLWQEIYQKGVILETDKILLVDLKKFKFPYKICDFNKDLQIQTQVGIIKETNQQSQFVVLQNPHDCYYPAVYKEKYKKVDLYINLLKKTAYLKLPPLIKPQEEIIFSEIYGNLKWQL